MGLSTHVKPLQQDYYLTLVTWCGTSDGMLPSQHHMDTAGATNSTCPTQAHSNHGTVGLLQLHLAPSLSELIVAIVQPQVITNHKQHFWRYTEFLAIFCKWHFLTPSTREKNISFAAECDAHRLVANRSERTASCLVSEPLFIYLFFWGGSEKWKNSFKVVKRNRTFSKLYVQIQAG